MNRALCTLVSSLVAAGITCGLFLTMVYLATFHGEMTDPDPGFSTFSFEQVDPPDVDDQPEPENLDPPDTIEPLPSAPALQLADMHAEPIDFTDAVPAIPGADQLTDGIGDVKFARLGLPAETDADIVPITRFQPVYPREPRLNGTEGHVVVAFTITTDGTVEDVTVVDAQPPGVFERAARRAIVKWNFEPRRVNGVAVERRASQRLDFTLEGGSDG